MGLSTLARIAFARTGIGAALGRMPLVKSVYASHAAARRDNPTLHWGVFATYDQALASVPRSRLRGWNNQEAATIWTDVAGATRPSSYPVYFWFRNLLQYGNHVADLGGSVGITFYGYRQHAALPDEVRWSVVEVPCIAAEGRRIAAREGAEGLKFETELAAISTCDLLLAVRTLQYMPMAIPGLLEGFTTRPRHILLNKVPFTDRDDFWTLQNFGPAIAPYRIFNEQRFLQYFKDYGYVVRDRWGVTDMYCDIPFYPDRTVEAFTGLYLECCDNRLAQLNITGDASMGQQ